MRREYSEFFDEPVVERTMNVELKSADGVGDVLDGVALAVGVVIHRIDAPFVASTVMMSVYDAVHDRVAEHHILAGHVNFRAEHLFAIGIFSSLHLSEKAKVLLDTAVSIRAVLSRLVYGSTPDADFLLRLVIDVCKSFLYKFLCPFVQLVEIVRSISFFCPLETEPLDVLLD